MQRQQIRITLIWETWPQKAQKWPNKPFLEFVNSLKNFVRFEGSFSKTLYAIFGSSVCNGMKIVCPFWDSFNFLKFSIRFEQTKFSTVILHHISLLYANVSKPDGWDLRNWFKICTKNHRKTFIFVFFLSCLNYCSYESNENPTVFLHHIRVLYVQWHQNCMVAS